MLSDDETEEIPDYDTLEAEAEKDRKEWAFVEQEDGEAINRGKRGFWRWIRGED